MTPDDPRHGTNAGAIAHWKAGESACPACARGKSRDRAYAELDRLAGRPRVCALGASAYAVVATHPLRQVSAATGLRTHYLLRLRREGPEKRVRRTTRDRLLRAGQGEFWTAVGIRRRLEAMMTLGWSMRAFAVEAGTYESTLTRILRRDGGPTFVRATLAEAIIEAYDRLEATPLTPNRSSTRARRVAVARGYVSPLAWDDIDNDDAPTGVRGDDLAQRHDVDTWEDYDYLTGQGCSFEEIAARLGLKPTSLAKSLRRRELAAGVEAVAS